MKSYRDKTAGAATYNVMSEWHQMAALAVQLRTGRNLNPAWVEEKTSQFKGIYKRLLTDPIDEVKKERKYRD